MFPAFHTKSFPILPEEGRYSDWNTAYCSCILLINCSKMQLWSVLMFFSASDIACLNIIYLHKFTFLKLFIHRQPLFSRFYKHLQNPLILVLGTKQGFFSLWGNGCTFVFFPLISIVQISHTSIEITLVLLTNFST